MASAFIGHSSKDKKFARRLAGDLYKNGIRIWIDEAELLVGDSLIEKISAAIYEMDYLIVILSKNSISSNWVQKELSMAMSHQIELGRIKVLPIVAGQCDIPLFLKDTLHLKMNTDASYSKNIPNLIKRLNQDDEEEKWYDLLSSNPHIIRRQTILYLGRRRDPSGVLPLIKLVKDKNERLEYRIEAINALDKIHDKRAIIPLIELFESADYRRFTRSDHIIFGCNLATVIGGFHDKRGIDPMIKTLRSKKEILEVKMSAASALGEIGDEDGLRILIKVLNDDNEYAELRGEAALAIGQIGSDLAVDTIYKFLEYIEEGRCNPDLRIYLVEGLQRAGYLADDD